MPAELGKEAGNFAAGKNELQEGKLASQLVLTASDRNPRAEELFTGTEYAATYHQDFDTSHDVHGGGERCADEEQQANRTTEFRP